MSFLKRFQDALESLRPTAENTPYVIAYSGGVDSHVLLHCCSQLNIPVRVVHIHHGLQKLADDWVDHCQTICDALNIPLDVIYVNAQQAKGQSPEEAARNARYQAIKLNLKPGECLLTAQHLNDQAETLLLQLFRTASTAGLSAMPEVRPLGNNMHLRPLLRFSRQEIEDYANSNSLHWVEDPTNQSESIDRNFVRKSIMPVLASRWPEITRQLATAARLQSTNLQVLEDMASIDLAYVIARQDYRLAAYAYEVMSVLAIGRLKQLSAARLLNVLRHWVIVTLDIQPTRNLLEEIDRALIHSQQDARPEIAYAGFVFRKFQDNLYLLKSNAPQALQPAVSWQPSAALTLPGLNIRLSAVDSEAVALDKSLLTQTLRVAFRQGGESFHPVGRRHSQRLKKLLQEANIPPWERERLPLVYFKDELVAVAGLWLAKKFTVPAGEGGWLIKLENV